MQSGTWRAGSSINYHPDTANFFSATGSASRASLPFKGFIRNNQPSCLSIPPPRQSRQRSQEFPDLLTFCCPFLSLSSGRLALNRPGVAARFAARNRTTEGRPFADTRPWASQVLLLGPEPAPNHRYLCPRCIPRSHPAWGKRREIF
jgi:hypothetical protein